MSYIIYLVWLAAFILLIYVIIKYNQKGNRQVRLEWYSVIQTVGVIIALALSIHSTLLSIEALNSADKSNQNTINALKEITGSTNKVKEALDSTSSKLVKLPDQLDSISSYFRSTLDRVTTLTNKQLDFLEQEQQYTIKELSRRPDLSIVPITFIKNDSLVILDGFEIRNFGDIEAEIQGISFYTEKWLLINDVGFSNFKEETDCYSFQFQPNNNENMVVIKYLQVKNNRIILKNLGDAVLELYPFVKYEIYYKSKYSSGIKTGWFNYKDDITDKIKKLYNIK
jgi:hypothetical protein